MNLARLETGSDVNFQTTWSIDAYCISQPSSMELTLVQGGVVAQPHVDQKPVFEVRHWEIEIFSVKSTFNHFYIL